MDQIENIAVKLKLDQFTHLEIVKQASEKTKLKPILVVAIAAVLLLLFFGLTRIGRVLLESTLLFFYPAYKSFHALKTEETYDDRRWLTYWIVFGFFYGFDSTFSFIFHAIPFWPLFRTAILVWIMHPAYGGAETVYTKGIRPLLDRYDEQIDKYLESAESKIQQFGSKAKKATAETISKNLLKTD